MDFGAKIKLFAKMKFGSVSALADALDISQPHLSQYINDKNKPGMEFFRKMSELGCDLNWLMSDDDRPPPEVTDIAQQLKDLEEENKRLRGSIGTIGLLAEIIEKGKHQLIEDAVDRAIKKALK
ncbi:hypothetical protein MTYM_01886 [Methylococcales bacterium]|nr:hypothetical protein MTYM_01886 [Methylococcales bacterium]